MTAQFFTFVLNCLPVKRFDILDSESMRWSIIPFYHLASITLVACFNIWDHAWALFFGAYGLMPLLDEIFSHDNRNPTEDEKKRLLEQSFHFELCLYVTMFLDWTLFFKCLNYLADFEPTFWNCINLPALLFVWGSLNGCEVAIAH